MYSGLDMIFTSLSAILRLDIGSQACENYVINYNHAFLDCFTKEKQFWRPATTQHDA